MKKALLLLFVFFTITYGDNSQRISELHFEIKSLEDQKPILFEIISQTKPVLTDIKSVKKQTKTYRDKMDAIIDDNLDKTLKTGALNTLLEIQGGNNGGKLVELGAWITGKIIGVSMEKSTFFGGVSHYKQKLDGISKEYETLTPELKKLSQLSKSSDEAIKSYYNKYGKYSEQFELGEIGVFTTRMRLIVEQADTALLALEALDLKLTRMLEDAQRDLKTIEENIKILREELEKLKNADKEEKPKEPEKKLELSGEDEAAGKIPEVKTPSIPMPNMPNGCYKTYKNQQEVSAILKAIKDIADKATLANIAVKSLMDKRDKEQSEYLESIKQKYTHIKKKYNTGTFYQHSLAGSAHEDVKQGRFPTGQPFSVFLSDTEKFDKDLAERIKTFKSDLQQLTDEMLLGLPTNDDAQIAQSIKNRDAYLSQYTKIHKECFQTIEYLEITSWYPSESIADALKSLKLEYLRELEKITSLAEEFPKWLEDRLHTLRIYFAKRRTQMQEEINQYEKEINEQDSIRSQITDLALKAMKIYKGNDFVKKDASYIYIPKTKMQENVCKTISALHAEFNTGAASSIGRIEKEIKNLLKLERHYTTSAMPINAYIEFGVDVAQLQKNQDEKAIKYSQIIQAYTTSGSNIHAIHDELDNNQFYQLGLFYPNTIFKELADKQMKGLQEIKNLIKNFKIETKNALESNQILVAQRENFQAYHKNIEKMFAENFGCLPLDYALSAGLLEEIEELKKVLSTLNSKQTYMNASSLFSALQELSNTIDNFSIDLDNPEKFLKDYQAIKDEYERLYTLINTTYANALFEVDKRKLNEELLKIEPKFSAYEEHKKFLSQQDGNSIVEELYKNFAQEYSNKNLSSLMSLISDEWQSQSDGTTLMDLEDTLGNSFSIFNEVNCNISSLNIQNVSSNLYRVNYVITIVGLIYENDIKHEEKSSVYEEVRIENGRAKISKTLNGRFWQER